MRGTNRGQTSGNLPQFRKMSASIKSGAKIGIFSRKTKFLPLFYFISGIKNPFLDFCIIDLTNNNILVLDGSPGTNVLSSRLSASIRPRAVPLSILTEPDDCTGWRCAIHSGTDVLSSPGCCSNSSPGLSVGISGRCCASGSAHTDTRPRSAAFNSSPGCPLSIRTAPDDCTGWLSVDIPG